MKVNFKSPQTLGNKDYKSGVQDVPDHLYANAKFVQLVKSGVVSVMPRDEAAQKIQAGKNARAAQKAGSAKADHQSLVDARATLKNNKAIVGVVAPVAVPAPAGPEFAPAPVQPAPVEASPTPAEPVEAPSPAAKKAKG